MTKRVGQRVLLTVIKAAAEHYHATLLARPDVLTYLGDERRIPDPALVADRYGLGYAPTRREGPTLARALRPVRESLSLNEADFDAVLVAAGLCKVDDSRAGVRDVFRGRLLFPFLRRGLVGDPFDWRGPKAEIVGFGGRLLPAVAATMPEGVDPPKYLNTSDTALFSKRELPFGLHPWAAQAVGREDRLFVVEGYFDWLRLQLLGVTNVIAVSGTALTAGHLEAVAALRRRSRMPMTVYLLTDSDAAGRRAADRGSQVVTERGLVARIMPVMPRKDVDESLAGLPTDEAVGLLRGWVEAAEWPMMVGLSAEDDAPWTRSLAALEFGFRRARRFVSTTPGPAREQVLNDLSARLRLHGRLQFGATHLRMIVDPEVSP